MSSLKDLQELGAFVPDEFVKQEIKFRFDGDEEDRSFVIHVRRISIGTQEAMYLGGEPDQLSRTAKFISETVRLGDNGDEAIPYVKAYTLHPIIGRAMTKAVNEVNGGIRKN